MTIVHTNIKCTFGSDMYNATTEVALLSGLYKNTVKKYLHDYQEGGIEKLTAIKLTIQLVVKS